MATTQDVNPTPAARSTEDLRAQMCRILDELVIARSDRASALKEEFEALWNELPKGGAPTLH
jgi:hypothetical protein